MDASSVILDYTDPSISRLVYVNTNIGGWFFDAVMQTDFLSELYITENPVETGASLTDFAYVKPTKVVFQIKMSDVAQSIVPGQFGGTQFRSIQAFQVLLTLQKARVPVQIMARIGGFQNMLVQSIAVPDDKTTVYGLLCTVTMQEVFVAQTSTVKISANKQVTGKTNRGTPEATQATGSVLSQLAKSLGISPAAITSALNTLGIH